MRIREQTLSRATPDRLWELIADPSLHPLWNPRIVETFVPDGDPAVGFRYRVTYELNGRRSEYDAEITEVTPHARFATRLRERNQGDGRHWQRFVEETLTLSAAGHRTRVRHDVRIHHSGIPLPWRALIWLIQRLGRPTGPTFVERLSDLAEDEPPRATTAVE